MPADVEDESTGDGGDAVDAAAHDERHLAGHDVADNSSADACDDSNEDRKEAVGVAGGEAPLVADDHKGGKAYCVGCVEGVVGVAGVDVGIVGMCSVSGDIPAVT